MVKYHVHPAIHLRATIMNRVDLVKNLTSLYENAKDRETVVSLHLFGIKYAEELKQNGSLKKIAEDAGIPSSYATEIRKGINLSKFVKLKSE